MNFETDVPMPQTKEDRVKAFKKMKIGESFAVDKSDAVNWRLAMSKAHSDGSCYLMSRTIGATVRFWRKA